ncbi:MAG: hypothetical protein ABI662_12785, partial [Dermatophilaceae bacterium]
VQAQAVLALHPKPPVIALDGDAAGREGTDRWLSALSLQRGRTALVTRLPDGVDPAEWLQHQGVSGLRAFDRRGYADPAADQPSPQMPGQDLVRICFDQPGEPVSRVLHMLTSLALPLAPSTADQLIDQAGREMTVRGWNPRGQFTQSARAAISRARHQAFTDQHLQAMTAAEGRWQLSTETPSPDAHHVA